MIRVLMGELGTPPEPPFWSIHSTRGALGFAGIAFDECRPDKLRGYGWLPGAKKEAALRRLKDMCSC
jgi:hypothetical protein